MNNNGNGGAELAAARQNTTGLLQANSTLMQPNGVNQQPPLVQPPMLPAAQHPIFANPFESSLQFNNPAPQLPQYAQHQPVSFPQNVQQFNGGGNPNFPAF